MGQSEDKVMDSRIMFDENGENGLIIGDRYIPEELLAEIFQWVCYETLLDCQLVCKRWKFIIQSYVWRKKAEKAIGRPLGSDSEMPWCVYYLMCKKKPFERNLIKNHSGELGRKKHWKILQDGGNRWSVEQPPVGANPLPKDDLNLFDDEQQYCFVTSYAACSMSQTVDLEAEGLTPFVLDNLRPTIAVGEWYSCRWDCPANYDCSVELLAGDGTVLDTFQFSDIITGEKQSKWLRVSHEFQHYSPSVRKVRFSHKGNDRLFWAGHYGSKMARAYVIVKLPEIRRTDVETADSEAQGTTSE